MALVESFSFLWESLRSDLIRGCGKKCILFHLLSRRCLHFCCRNFVKTSRDRLKYILAAKARVTLWLPVTSFSALTVVHKPDHSLCATWCHTVGRFMQMKWDPAAQSCRVSSLWKIEIRCERSLTQNVNEQIWICVCVCVFKVVPQILPQILLHVVQHLKSTSQLTLLPKRRHGQGWSSQEVWTSHWSELLSWHHTFHVCGG